MRETGIAWRDTARSLRFFVFDARVLCGLIVWALHVCMETFVAALVIMCIFGILEFFGLRLVAAMRELKNFWADKYRTARPRSYGWRRALW